MTRRGARRRRGRRSRPPSPRGPRASSRDSVRRCRQTRPLADRIHGRSRRRRRPRRRMPGLRHCEVTAEGRVVVRHVVEVAADVGEDLSSLAVRLPVRRQAGLPAGDRFASIRPLATAMSSAHRDRSLPGPCRTRAHALHRRQSTPSVRSRKSRRSTCCQSVFVSLVRCVTKRSSKPSLSTSPIATPMPA